MLGKIPPSFVQAITNDTPQVLGAPTERLRLRPLREGSKSGHRLLPAKFPLASLSDEVYLSDSGLLLMAGTTVDYKLQGIFAFVSPERCHERDPSPASDMWSFMVVFVYLYLESLPFSNSHDILKELGPFPAEWTKPEPRYDIS